MKRTELIRRIKAEAKAAGLAIEFEREGAGHEIWRVGDVRVVLTRHVEVSPGVERRIQEDLEPLFGRRWWQ